VQPRKTLRNNISATYSRVVADAAIADAGLDPTARPAVLTLQEFQKLAMSIHLFGA
jgi:16S rRNA A1518/A1519 N6-dimethyltransferase RsmA/KsgA/DIM1 with predicted DNA glycosylase/AP lyase activity